MIKTKFVFAVSFLALFVATDYAFGAIASSGYVDQQVDTRLSSITGSTTGEGNVVTEVTASGGAITATKGINAEVTSNKATAESVVADDKGSTEKYPSVAAAEKIAEVAAQTASENSLQKDGALTEGNLLKSDASGKAVDSGVASDKVLTNTATGAGALGVNADSSGNNSIAIAGSRSSGTFASGTNSIAIGNSFGYGGNVVAEGSNSIALGTNSYSGADYAIQLGRGSNSEANTFSVGLSDSNNYKLLGSDGKIPAERLPFEGDVLTNTATGSDSFSTGGAIPVTSEGAVVLGASSSTSGNASVVVGSSSSATNDFSTALGPNTNVTATGGTAVGNAAKVAAESAIQLGYGTNNEANTLSVGLSVDNNYKLLGSDGKIPVERMPFEGTVVTNTNPSGFAIGGADGGYNGFAIGVAANGGGYGVAVGPGSSADNYSVSVGRNAKSSNGGIQIGTGTNSEDNTLSIGLSSSNNYKLLGSDGKIPSERLPAAMIPVGSSTSPTSYATFWIE